MTIAITGASGALGRRTAELVLDGYWDPEDLLLLTRTPDAIADLARRGARVEKASFKNPTGLKQVLAGVERLLVISTPQLGIRADQQRQAVAIAKQVGVQHLVYTSVVRPSADNPALLVPDHAVTEQAIRDTGLDWTFLRNNLYADLVALQAPGMAEAGVHVTNAGDGATAYVAREDCAAAAAAVLTTDGHEKESYDLTGPEAFTQAQIAALVAERFGTEIELFEQDDDDQRQSLIEAGMEPEAAAVLASIGGAQRKGFFAKVTSDVAELTGRPATPLADVLSR